jgi:SapB morphogen precursor RamS
MNLLDLQGMQPVRNNGGDDDSALSVLACDGDSGLSVALCD